MCKDLQKDVNSPCMIGSLLGGFVALDLRGVPYSGVCVKGPLVRSVFEGRLSRCLNIKTSFDKRFR